MRVSNISKMEKGWFIGNFNPSLLKTNECEVAVKTYQAGDYEKEHYHKVATEYTVVVEGVVKMFGHMYGGGLLFCAEPVVVTELIQLNNPVSLV